MEEVSLINDYNKEVTVQIQQTDTNVIKQNDNTTLLVNKIKEESNIANNIKSIDNNNMIENTTYNHNINNNSNIIYTDNKKNRQYSMFSFIQLQNLIRKNLTQHNNYDTSTIYYSPLSLSDTTQYINLIIKNKQSRVNFQYKEMILEIDEEEHFSSYWEKEEAYEVMIKILNYYENYSLFIPFFPYLKSNSPYIENCCYKRKKMEELEFGCVSESSISVTNNRISVNTNLTNLEESRFSKFINTQRNIIPSESKNEYLEDTQDNLGNKNDGYNEDISDDIKSFDNNPESNDNSINYSRRIFNSSNAYNNSASFIVSTLNNIVSLKTSKSYIQRQKVQDLNSLYINNNADYDDEKITRIRSFSVILDDSIAHLKKIYSYLLKPYYNTDINIKLKNTDNNYKSSNNNCILKVKSNPVKRRHSSQVVFNINILKGLDDISIINGNCNNINNNIHHNCYDSCNSKRDSTSFSNINHKKSSSLFKKDYIEQCDQQFDLDYTYHHDNDIILSSTNSKLMNDYSAFSLLFTEDSKMLDNNNIKNSKFRNISSNTNSTITKKNTNMNANTNANQCLYNRNVINKKFSYKELLKNQNKNNNNSVKKSSIMNNHIRNTNVNLNSKYDKKNLTSNSNNKVLNEKANYLALVRNSKLNYNNNSNNNNDKKSVNTNTNTSKKPFNLYKSNVNTNMNNLNNENNIHNNQASFTIKKKQLLNIKSNNENNSKDIINKPSPKANKRKGSFKINSTNTVNNITNNTNANSNNNTNTKIMKNSNIQANHINSNICKNLFSSQTIKNDKSIKKTLDKNINTNNNDNNITDKQLFSTLSNWKPNKNTSPNHSSQVNSINNPNKFIRNSNASNTISNTLSNTVINNLNSNINNKTAKFSQLKGSFIKTSTNKEPVLKINNKSIKTAHTCNTNIAKNNSHSKKHSSIVNNICNNKLKSEGVISTANSSNVNLSNNPNINTNTVIIEGNSKTTINANTNANTNKKSLIKPPIRTSRVISKEKYSVAHHNSTNTTNKVFDNQDKNSSKDLKAPQSDIPTENNISVSINSNSTNTKNTTNNTSISKIQVSTNKSNTTNTTSIVNSTNTNISKTCLKIPPKKPESTDPHSSNYSRNISQNTKTRKNTINQTDKNESSNKKTFIIDEEKDDEKTSNEISRNLQKKFDKISMKHKSQYNVSINNGRKTSTNEFNSVSNCFNSVNANNSKNKDLVNKDIADCRFSLLKSNNINEKMSLGNKNKSYNETKFSSFIINNTCNSKSKKSTFKATIDSNNNNNNNNSVKDAVHRKQISSKQIIKVSEINNLLSNSNKAPIERILPTTNRKSSDNDNLNIQTRYSLAENTNEMSCSNIDDVPIKDNYTDIELKSEYKENDSSKPNKEENRYPFDKLNDSTQLIKKSLNNNSGNDIDNINLNIHHDRNSTKSLTYRMPKANHFPNTNSNVHSNENNTNTTANLYNTSAITLDKVVSFKKESRNIKSKMGLKNSNSKASLNTFNSIKINKVVRHSIGTKHVQSSNVFSSINSSRINYESHDSAEKFNSNTRNIINRVHLSNPGLKRKEDDELKNKKINSFNSYTSTKEVDNGNDR